MIARRDFCYWSLVIGYWLLVIGHWSLVIGYWSLVIGYWSLVIGYWLLVIGYLFLLKVPNIQFFFLANPTFSSDRLLDLPAIAIFDTVTLWASQPPMQPQKVWQSAVYK